MSYIHLSRNFKITGSETEMSWRLILKHVRVRGNSSFPYYSFSPCSFSAFFLHFIKSQLDQNDSIYDISRREYKHFETPRTENWTKIMHTKEKFWAKGPRDTRIIAWSRGRPCYMLPCYGWWRSISCSQIWCEPHALFDPWYHALVRT